MPVEREDLAVVARRRPGPTPAWRSGIWTVLAEPSRLDDVTLEAGAAPGLHPTRAARIVGAGGVALGAVGEVDPDVVAAYGLTGRVGYFRVDLEARRPPSRPAAQARPVSRFPASDVDLAFVVADDVPAAAVRRHPAGARRRTCSRSWTCSTCSGAAARRGHRSLA